MSSDYLGLDRSGAEGQLVGPAGEGFQFLDLTARIVTFNRAPQ